MAQRIRRGDADHQGEGQHDGEAARDDRRAGAAQILRQPIDVVIHRLEQVGADRPAVDRVHQFRPAEQAQVGDHGLGQAGVGDRALQRHPGDLGTPAVQGDQYRGAQQAEEEVGRQPGQGGRPIAHLALEGAFSEFDKQFHAVFELDGGQDANDNYSIKMERIRN